MPSEIFTNKSRNINQRYIRTKSSLTPKFKDDSMLENPLKNALD